jgi:transcriptional regulator with XRE-family HTH domain
VVSKERAPIDNVERGRENISINSLTRVAKALKVAMRDLVSGIPG